MRVESKNQIRKWLKSELTDLYWKVYGNTVRNPIWPNYATSFLFVCRGNICRSPFAEHLMRKLAVNAATEEKTLYSAGLEVSQPVPPPKEAIMAAESFSVELDSHRARRIDHEMLESFDIIFTMETWQFQTLRKAFPKHKDKIFLLPLFEVPLPNKRARLSRYNIPDPYGKSLDEFHGCFQRIERCVKGLFNEMQRLREKV